MSKNCILSSNRWLTRPRPIFWKILTYGVNIFFNRRSILHNYGYHVVPLATLGSHKKCCQIYMGLLKHGTEDNFTTGGDPYLLPFSLKFYAFLANFSQTFFATKYFIPKIFDRMLPKNRWRGVSLVYCLLALGSIDGQYLIPQCFMDWWGNGKIDKIF